MRKNFLLVILIFTLFYAPVLKGQFIASGIEESQQVKTTILAVVEREKDEKRIKKLRKKPEELKVYEEGVVDFNRLLKKAVEQEWSFSKNVAFITKEEAEKIREEKDPQYCFLEAIEISNRGMSNYSHIDKSYNNHWALGGIGMTLGLAVTWAKEPKTEIVASYLPNDALSLGALIFAVQNLQHQLKNAVDHGIKKISQLKKEVDARSHELQNKTLLLFDPLISKGLEKELSKNRLNKFYKYAYKKVNYDEVQKAIVSHNSDYAYTWVIPAGAEREGGTVLSNYLIVNAEDGKILYVTGRAVSGSHGTFHQAQLKMAEKEINK